MKLCLYFLDWLKGVSLHMQYDPYRFRSWMLPLTATIVSDIIPNRPSCSRLFMTVYISVNPNFTLSHHWQLYLLHIKPQPRSFPYINYCYRYINNSPLRLIKCFISWINHNITTDGVHNKYIIMLYVICCQCMGYCKIMIMLIKQINWSSIIFTSKQSRICKYKYNS